MVRISVRESWRALGKAARRATVFMLAAAAASHALAASVTLAWDPVTTPVAASGYMLYYGLAAGNYPNKIDVGNVATRTITGLGDGTTYHFAVTAYDATRRESGFSNDVTYTTPGAALVSWGLLVDEHSITGTTSNSNGILEPGETVVVEPVWQNASGNTYTLTGSISNLAGPAGATYGRPDSSASYGTVSPGNTATCPFATNGCYRISVSNPVIRPAVRWELTFTETLSSGLAVTHSIHIGGSFHDVPPSDPTYANVETLVRNYIAAGYADGTFAPQSITTRKQAAALLARGLVARDAITPPGDAGIPVSGLVGTKSYNCVAGGVSRFVDVLPTDSNCKHVHFLASRGAWVSVECSDSVHACLAINTTRAAMAVLVAGTMAAGGDSAVPVSGTFNDSGSARSYNCASAGGSHFPDVAVGTPYCRHVNYLWARGVIDGRPDGTYQPAAALPRGWAAKFVVNAYKLTLD